MQMETVFPGRKGGRGEPFAFKIQLDPTGFSMPDTVRNLE